MGEGTLVIGGKLSSNDLHGYATVTSCEFVKGLNIFSPSMFFSLYLNTQLPFMENILPHGPNSLLLNLSNIIP